MYAIGENCIGCGMCLSICPVKAITGGPGRIHSINEDLCIGCGACARVCESSCVFDSDGNASQRESKSHWLVPHFDEKACMRCGKCYEMCPAGIIRRPHEDSIPVLLNPRLCASCRWCEKVCVYRAITFSKARPDDSQTVAAGAGGLM